MDDLRLDSRAYDPAHVAGVIREARRMRNAMLIDAAKALLDGRLWTRLTGDRPAGLPKGAAPQG